jgi:hypothetical protein
MYAGLFLMPWILMYAVSTIVMNHRAAFRVHYGGSLVRWVKEDERTYSGQFAGRPTLRPWPNRSSVNYASKVTSPPI